MDPTVEVAWGEMEGRSTQPRTGGKSGDRSVRNQILQGCGQSCCFRQKSQERASNGTWEVQTVHIQIIEYNPRKIIDLRWFLYSTVRLSDVGGMKTCTR